MAASLVKFKLPNSTNKTPIVYLLGWGGSKMSQLDKYSQIYEEKGCNVTRYIPPFGKLSGRSFKSYEKFAHDFYQRALIEVKDDVERPIVFHAFSMNGISVFCKVWDMLSEHPDGAELKPRIKGVVFDSGPADTIPSSSATAFSVATFPPNSGFLNAIGRVGMYLLVYTYVAIFRSIQWFKYLTYDSLIFEREICYYRMLKIGDFPKKQVYLYSKIDSMIRYKDVDKFIAHQRTLGAEIDSKCFEDSPHIQHLRVHPEEYRSRCSNFIDEILKKS